ncbi:Holliday junction resolvase RuvX [bacterium]|nr:Holliday junction resolvase RuvX [bacterium]
MTVLAVDPGTAKCGLAVVARERGCLERVIVNREDLLSQVRQYLERFPVERVLVGGATGSKPVVQELKQHLAISVEVVDEFRTTERARGRYFQDHPPRGFWRLVPLGLQTPAVAIDDYAAIVMAEDWFSGKERQ